MVRKIWQSKIIVLFIVFAAMVIIYSCKGSETRKAAEEIRDEVTGNRAVQQGEKAKKNIEEIKKENADRMENFKEQTGNTE